MNELLSFIASTIVLIVVIWVGWKIWITGFDGEPIDWKRELVDGHPEWHPLIKEALLEPSYIHTGVGTFSTSHYRTRKECGPR